MFNTVKRYFDLGLYTEEQVKIFVLAKRITEAEYKEITGVVYKA